MVAPWSGGWPYEVRNSEDMCMFVEMMTGCGRSQQVDLSSDLRHVACQGDDFSDCFLVLVKGADCPNAVKVTRVRGTTSAALAGYLRFFC